MTPKTRTNGMTVLHGRLALVTLLALFTLIACGGGGGSSSHVDPDNINISGVVDDGGDSAPIAYATCRFVDADGHTQDTDTCDQNGSYRLSVPPGVQGYIYCSPPTVPNLILSTFASTVGAPPGGDIGSENVTPATTLAADIIQHEDPDDPETRKRDLLNAIVTKADPNLEIVVAMATRLYRTMLAQQVNAGFRSGGNGGSGGDGGDGDGRSDSGGVGGDAGDGADFSPLPGAQCSFVVGTDLLSAEPAYPSAMADFLTDGELDRPDLAPLASSVSGDLDYTADDIKQAFGAVFPQGMGDAYTAVADTEGRYFLPIPANLPGFVRCTPQDHEALSLATYVPGRSPGEVLDGQDVNPASTVFSVLIAPQLDGDLAAIKRNFLADIEGLETRLSGDNLPEGPLTDFQIVHEPDLGDKDVKLVAFSVTALFNAFYKNDLDMDFLTAITELPDNLAALPAFLEDMGLPGGQADIVNTAIATAAGELGTSLEAALSTARMKVTVLDAADGSAIPGAVLDIENDLTCEGCGDTTDANGEKTLSLSPIPLDAVTPVQVTVSSAPGFEPVSIATKVIAFATVDVTVQLSASTAAHGSISGAVADALDETPLEGVSVSVYNGNQQVASATTDSQGIYTLECAVGPTYTLTYEIEGYLPTRYDNVTVSAGSTTFLQIALQVSAADSGVGDMAGTIRNAVNNNGVADVSLELHEGINNLSGEALATATTDADGAYVFNEIPAGVYTASASHGGYHDLHFTVVSVGGQLTDAQDASMSPALASGEIRIVLTWGSTPADLDSHLTGPSSAGGSFHCYYSTKDPDNGNVILDLDDTNGNGPETTTIAQRFSGTYQFQVHDFTNGSSTTSSALSDSSAQVKVYGDTGEIAAFNVPSGQVGTVWTVFDLDGASGQITPRNTLDNSTPVEAVRSLLMGK